MKRVVILSAVEESLIIRERSEKGGSAHGGSAAPSGDGTNLTAFGCAQLTSSDGALDPPKNFPK